VRIDLFLKKILIFKKRNEAKMMCNKELIKVNGRISKPSRNVRKGDVIEIETFHGLVKLKILEIPAGNVKKSEADLYYERL